MEVKQECLTEYPYENLDIKTEPIEQDESLDTVNTKTEVDIKDEPLERLSPSADQEMQTRSDEVSYDCEIPKPNIVNVKCESVSEVDNGSSNTDINNYAIYTSVHSTSDLVAFLLKEGFNSLSYRNKLLVVNERGRPCPSLSNLVNVRNANSQNRKFNQEWYKKCDWLTGSRSKNKLFCWPCLLFSENKKCPWNTTGTDNLKTISRGIERHSTSKDHIYAALKLKLFGKQNKHEFLNKLHSDMVKYNESVKENREVLSRLIDMTIYLASQEQSLRNQDESVDDFKELVEFLSRYDSKFDAFLKESSVYTELAKTIRNDLLDSITHVLNKKIESEIENCVCFSWQVDKTTDVGWCSQLSVIFRYICEGKIVERFMGFFDSSEVHADLLMHNYEKFNLKEKLIGQAYDGAAVISEELNELQTKVKAVAPLALFTHSSAHSLNLILQDALMAIQDCKVFFATISEFCRFFTRSPKRTSVLEKVSACKWEFKSRIVSTILESKDVLVDALNFMISNSEFSNDKTTVHEAVSFKKFLNDNNTLFLLQTFHLIFERTDSIHSIIENKSNDVSYCVYEIENVIETLRKYQDENSYFDKIYENTVITVQSPPIKKRKSATATLPYTTYALKSLFNEILDIIVMQIELRFENVSKLNFFYLVDKNRMPIFRNKFPIDLMNQLCETFPNFFLKDKLENELRVLYSDPSIIDHATSFQEMLHFIYCNSLKDDIPEIYKLLSVILSLPEISFEGSLKLKRIKAVARNAASRTRLAHLSSIFIEKELLKSLQKTSKFIDNVIDHFAATEDRGIDLIYKNV